jgi:hypothetical protein
MWIRTANRLLNADKLEAIEVTDAKPGRCQVTADGAVLADLPTRVEAVRLLDAIESALINALPVFDVREEMQS